jgi:hypothetical protein
MSHPISLTSSLSHLSSLSSLLSPLISLLSSLSSLLSHLSSLLSFPLLSPLSLSDHARLRSAADSADAIHRAVSQRLQLYRAELPATFAGGHDMLARIGELSASR